jgi:hypothetical protein
MQNSFVVVKFFSSVAKADGVVGLNRRHKCLLHPVTQYILEQGRARKQTDSNAEFFCCGEILYLSG